MFTPNQTLELEIRSLVDAEVGGGAHTYTFSLNRC